MRLKHELLQQQKHELFLSVADFAARHLQPVIKLPLLSYWKVKCCCQRTESQLWMCVDTWVFCFVFFNRRKKQLLSLCMKMVHLSISSHRSVVCKIESCSNYWIFTINHSNRILITWVTNIQQCETQPRLNCGDESSYLGHLHLLTRTCLPTQSAACQSRDDSCQSAFI